MRWAAAFVDLVLYFASRVAETGEMPIEEALLTSTPLYLNLGLGRSFDPRHPVWQEFLAGYLNADDPVSWTHAIYMEHAREYGPTPYGCFAYHYEPETRSIRFHFGNRDTSGFGPLSAARAAVRRQELTAMVADIRREVPEAEWVRGRSWMYNLPAYRCLFPPAYIQTAVAVEPELQYMSLWGQFLDRHWNLRLSSARIFRQRLTVARTLDATLQSFPLAVLAPRCSIDHFYELYG